MVNLKKELESNKVLLLIVSGLEYNDRIVKVMKVLSGKSVAYVTLNKTNDSLKELFKKKKVDITNLVFVDAISKTFKKAPEQAESVFYCSSPGSLTELSLIITKFLKHDFDYIIFDSLTNLAPYQKRDIIIKFLSSLANKIKSSKTKAIFYALDVKDGKELIQQASVYMDNVINAEEINNSA
ncbi:MAG TPA: hypothetical protein VJH65_02750 [Candidatus Nanoarchaeia archaeon]|nr:hypothetical protein [Candidatus Nanoarchaeia archaeon]